MYFGLFGKPEAMPISAQPDSVLKAAESHEGSAAHDLLGRVFTIQNVVGGLACAGTHYHHSVIAVQRRQPSLNISSLIMNDRWRNPLPNSRVAH
jgi:hypothetical protein